MAARILIVEVRRIIRSAAQGDQCRQRTDPIRTVRGAGYAFNEKFGEA